MANLQRLSGAVVDSIRVDKWAGTIEGLGNIKKLTKLGILLKDDIQNQNAIGVWISSLTNLQSLKLGIINSSKPSALPSELSLSYHYSLSKLYLLGRLEQDWNIQLPHNLISLTLCGSCMTNEHIDQLGNLTNLKFLNPRAKAFAGNLLKFPKALLQNLQILRLWKLEDLVTIELEDHLPQIKIIELRNCPKIENINHIWRLRRQRIVLLQLIDIDARFVKQMNSEVEKLSKLGKENYLITVKTTKPSFAEAANFVGYN